jgi:transcriptional regulator with XRE-family HTH domain
MYRKIKTIEDLGAFIKIRRKELKVPQVELAGLSRVGTRFLIELEAGKPTIQFSKALSIINTLGIDLYAAKREDL